MVRSDGDSEKVEGGAVATSGCQTRALPKPFEVVTLDRDHAKAIDGNLLLMVWRYETTLPAFRQGFELAERLAARYPAGFGVCQVVEIDAVPPSAETREAFVEFLRLPRIRHFSLSYEGAGFKAAAVRAVVAACHALARPSCQHSVHSSVRAAATWHEQRQRELGVESSAQSIVQVIEALRVQLDAT
jgi:hypothetical protein